jgi:hypothetical protein
VTTLPTATLALDRGPVRVGVRLVPLRLDLARSGSTVLGGLRPWLADGVVPVARRGLDHLPAAAGSICRKLVVKKR